MEGIGVDWEEHGNVLRGQISNYEFARAAVTTYCRLSNLNHRYSFSHSSGGRKSMHEQGGVEFVLLGLQVAAHSIAFHTIIHLYMCDPGVFLS